ncbi:FIST signal transduction protein [Paractinoplanes rhizophilus]|uniref:FIST signal transduction protein n=1 Tax=Paractinoplanes rhizophilus TaxID=1416877 RepID=A0ABW2HSE9_9ACTN|nr:FIST N-terminal domain-containing protein [Actinoplanes sp.]
MDDDFRTYAAQRTRWFDVGVSSDDDPHRAGAAAASRALTGPDPRLLVVFCSIRMDPHAVLAGIKEVAAGVPLIGCSSGAELSVEGPGAGGVTVAAFGGSGFSVRTSAATGTRTAPREGGLEVARSAFAGMDGANQLMLLLTDGLVDDQDKIIGGVYEMLGAGVALAGGAAGTALKPDGSNANTFHMHDGEVLTDAVVAAAITSDGPFGVAMRHGFREVGEPMMVTRSRKGRIYTLDNRPALHAYLDRLGAPAEAYHDKEAFVAFSRLRPLCVLRRATEEVRFVTEHADLGEGSLMCVGDVPEGGMVWPLESDADSTIEAVDRVWPAAVEALGGRPARGFLVFDCGIRQDILSQAPAGDQGGEEVGRMVRQAGGLPFVGFYTWGEIARVRGVNGLHHQSLVVLAVG